MSIAQKMIDYDPSITITNLESLPKGTGARYLVVIESPYDREYVAKRWARSPPKRLGRLESVVRFGGKERMNMPDEYSYSEYKDWLRSTAEEIVEDHPNERRDHNERTDRVFESVDGSSWIIYTAGAEAVLKHTRNEPDGKEVQAMAGPDADWRKQQQVAAFLAMEIDLWEAIREADSEREGGE